MPGWARNLGKKFRKLSQTSFRCIVHCRATKGTCPCPKHVQVFKIDNIFFIFQDLKRQDRDYESERERLSRCKLCLEERLKMLNQDVNRQQLQQQLFAQVKREAEDQNSLSTTVSTNTVSTSTSTSLTPYFVKEATKTAEIGVNTDFPESYPLFEDHLDLSGKDDQDLTIDIVS